ncbi:AAA family ATPase [Streptomyces sp. NPDC102370]|uniref:helix-turn-helix transcriptional regulator n=1 Tax=Streptomyces sp. NPDC102370 TaxID=3366163 RepID=UPI0038090EC1
MDPLSERDDALRLLAAGAERARAGSGRLVLLRGATGTGRTALLRAAAQQASARGMRVLRARCTPEDRGTDWGVARQLFGEEADFLQDAPAASAHVPAASAHVPAAHTPSVPARTQAEPGPTPAERRRTRGALLWRLLETHARRAPLFVAVDDVHAADPSSRRWLTEAARLVDGLPVLLVVTERSQYDIDQAAPGLAHGLSPAFVHTHTLAPLSADAATGLVRAAFPQAAPDRVADCVRAGAGNPLLLRALLHDLSSWNADDGTAPPAALPDTCAALYPGAYPDVVSWWLAGAGGATARVARCLAVLESAEADAAAVRPPAADGTAPARDWCPGYCPDERRDTQARITARMAQADPDRVTGWLTAMTRLGLLRRGEDGLHRYAHPLLRDAVLSGWTSGRRREAHRTAAEELMREGALAGVVAGHLFHGSAVAEPWAVDILVEAAGEEVRAGRPRCAVAYLRRALDEPMAPVRRATVLIQLGSLECAAHPSGGLARLAQAVRLPGESRDRVRAMVALATALARSGETGEALRLLREEEQRLAGRPGLVRTLRAVAVLMSDATPDALRPEHEAPLPESDGDGPDLLDAARRMQAVRHGATAGLISSRDAMDRIRALTDGPADPLAVPFLFGMAALVAHWADELDEAEQLVRRALDPLGSFLLHPMHHILTDVRVDLAAARADHDTVLAEPSARTPRIRSSGPGPTSAHTQAVIALVETGRLEEAARLVDGFELPTAPDSWRTHRFLYARGVLRAAAGEPAAALEDFEECGRRQASREAYLSVASPWRVGAAECLLALGRRHEALSHAEEEARLAEVWHTPRVRGRALRVLGEATGGRRGLRLTGTAVALLRGTPADAELIAALIAHGRLLVASRERSQAREALYEAVERAERLGAVRLRGVAEELLHEGGARRAGAPRTGPAALTDSERRIAGLAAEGRTNAEIAASLHLARRTVETHLTAAYRKLGITRRTELPAALPPSPHGPPARAS